MGMMGKQVSIKQNAVDSDDNDNILPDGARRNSILKNYQENAYNVHSMVKKKSSLKATSKYSGALVLDDSSEASIKGFINDLSKLKGKVYFSYHDQNLMQVINAHATPYLETCYLHFFNIREPTPLIANNSDVKVCDAFSIQCRD